MGRAAAASWTFHSVYRFHHLADTHRPWTTDWILFFFFVFLPALLSRTTINRRNRIMWPLSLGTQQAGLVESFRFPRSETLRRRRCSIFISFCVATRELGGFFSSLIVLVSPVRVWLSLWSKASGRFFFIWLFFENYEWFTQPSRGRETQKCPFLFDTIFGKCFDRIVIKHPQPKAISYIVFAGSSFLPGRAVFRNKRNMIIIIIVIPWII